MCACQTCLFVIGTELQLSRLLCCAIAACQLQGLDGHSQLQPVGQVRAVSLSAPYKTLLMFKVG
jgi:hypothetical protein